MEYRSSYEPAARGSSLVSRSNQQILHTPGCSTIRKLIKVTLQMETVQVQEGAFGIHRKIEELHDLKGGVVHIVHGIIRYRDHCTSIQNPQIALSEDFQARFNILVTLLRCQKLND